MMRKIFTGMILLLCGAAVWAAAGQARKTPRTGFPAGIVIDGFGNPAFGGLKWEWTCYSIDWHGAALNASDSQMSGGFPRLGPGRFEVQQTWNGFRMNVTAISEKDGNVAYSARFHADSPVETATLALVTNLSLGTVCRLKADGKDILLPPRFRNVMIFSGNVHSFQYEVNGRTVTFAGDFPLLVQDNRKWNSNNFTIRVGTTPRSGKITDAAQKLTILVESPHTADVDLKSVCNMGFLDDCAGDGKGGWTDQGPACDLRMIRPGKLSMLGVDFTIVDPAKNHGRSCLVLSSGRGGFPSEKSVGVIVSKRSSCYLYLLHASAWTPGYGKPVGKLTVEYADGSRTDFPILAGRDVGDWWKTPCGFSNGALAWTGETHRAFVGLYLSQFRINGTPKTLTFRAADGGNVVWMIVGGTFGDRELNFTQLRTPSYVVAGKDWIPLEYTGKIVAGSPLDFSASLDAPAGKYGPVTVGPDGHFSFRDAPDKRIRFFGPNLVGTANYPDKATADDFVAKAVRLGYNSVRLHHYENDGLSRDAADSLTFDPVMLDRFFYLFSELKKHGVYITMDLYDSRRLKPGDHVVELPDGGDFKFKVLLPVSPSAMANWKKFARRLLMTKNPYTGLTLAEDPALYSLNLVNENSLLAMWSSFPELIPLYEAKYVEFLKRKELDTPENRKARNWLFIEFLNELQARSIEEQMRFLREELHVTALATDLNWISKYTLAGLRNKLDFVDDHQYWDHPRFLFGGWRYPYLFLNSSAIGGKAKYPRELMPVRIFGKPYTVTEFNFCAPNPYRNEGASLIGGYAALQDWDGLYRFAWSHSRDAMKNIWRPDQFNAVNDPGAQLRDRIIYFLFLRGYVANAKPAFAFTWTPEMIRGIGSTPGDSGKYPDHFTELGLYARIGTLPAAVSFPGVQKIDPFVEGWKTGLPEKVRKVLNEFDKTGRIVSSTGEITLNAEAKSMSVVTPKAEVLTFRSAAAGRIMCLSHGTGYQTVALLSLDGNPLADSRKILLFQLSDLSATKRRFGSAHHNLLENWGTLPLLLERCRAEVELKLPAMKVEALKLDGSSNGVVATTYRNGKLCFTLDTASRPGGVMVSLLSR